MNKQAPMKSTGRKINRGYQGMMAAVLIATCLAFTGVFNTGCGIYKFRDISIPDSIKTVKVNFIENRAQYVNPQLSPRLTDKVRQKIVSQTRLSQTNNDNADWVINGTITNYSVSTSGISNQHVATNRLTVGVHLILNDQRSDKTTEYDVSRSFEFSAGSTLEAAQAGLFDEILRGMSDDIFNRLFSNW
ncbi:MAG TPA: LptE family protein [Chitinophagaceae bacterium]|nr:LptE family protein [Chitinophagaceae bacterium]